MYCIQRDEHSVFSIKPNLSVLILHYLYMTLLFWPQISIYLYFHALI